MDKEINSKWFVIGGAALSFLGFFLKFISFSFAGFGISSISASNAANSQNFLYLIPACFVIVILIEVMGTSYPNKSKQLWIGKTTLSVLGILLTIALIIIAFNKQSGLIKNINAGLGVLNQYLSIEDLPNAKTTPGIGLFVFLVGFLILGKGLMDEWNALGNSQSRYVSSGNSYGGENYQEIPRQSKVAPNMIGNGVDQVEDHFQERMRSRPATNNRSAADVAYRMKNKLKVSAWLVSREGTNYQLCTGETTIGRLSDNSIQLSNSKVSKHHAKIIETNNHFKLMDLNSTNGTWLNGKLVREPVALHSEDEIRFGDSYKVQFVAITK
ncbi:MAG: FHA domain-containing protein [Anaerolineaceae bacterium]